MRVLVASFAHRSHFQGMVPMAWALVAAGHDVRVASHPALAGTITSAGLPAVPVGVDHRLFDITPEAAAEVHRYSNDLDFSRRGAELESWEFLHGMASANVRWVDPVINNDEFIDALVDVAVRWRPDLVLWEPLTFAGAIAARACGAAHARLVWGSDLGGLFRTRFTALRDGRPAGDRPDPLGEWLTDVGSRFGVGFGEDLAVGQWTVDQSPARFQLETGLETLHFWSIPYNGAAEIPDWLRGDDETPRICVTSGFSESGLTRVLSALGDLDEEIVVTRSDLDPDSVPTNVRLVDFVPMNALLPHCRAVVHHGGVGTWASAVNHGVPQVTVAHEWECVLRCQQTAGSGAGVALHPNEADPPAVEGALRTVLDDPSYTRSADALRTEVLAEPPPAAVVSRIEELVDRHAASTTTH